MANYEMRLSNKAGRTTLIYRFLTLDDTAAIRMLRDVPCETFARYEIWRGMELVEEGPNVLAN